MCDERHMFRIKHFLPHWLLINFSSKHDRMESMLFALRFPISIASLGQENLTIEAKNIPNQLACHPDLHLCYWHLINFVSASDWKQFWHQSGFCLWNWTVSKLLLERKENMKGKKCIKISHANNISSLFLMPKWYFNKH